MANTANAHEGMALLSAGATLERASAAMVMVHGRGASAEDILMLAAELKRPDIAYLAPQAAGNTWYPNSFLAPMDTNEPWLSWALARLSGVLAKVEAAGIPPEQTMLLGFSQGACLTLEYAARHARRYGGIAGLSGGLIGPDGTPRDYAGSFDGTPVFLGCSDVDFHIPKERVLETAGIFTRMGAKVTARLYPNMGHTVNRDELDFVRGMAKTLTEGAAR